MSRKDDEVTVVARRLDGLLDDLAASVGALSEILTRPARPPDGGEENERLVVP